MPTRRQTANDDALFWTLKVLQENPGVSQRSLAKEVGINVSTINFCLKALVEKGWIKMGNFSKNPDKLSYAYLLTPTGVAEKAVLTRRFLQRKMPKAVYDQHPPPHAKPDQRRLWLRHHHRRASTGRLQCARWTTNAGRVCCSQSLTGAAPTCPQCHRRFHSITGYAFPTIEWCYLLLNR